MKKDQTPFADYGDITPQQWEDFGRQKNSEESLALSKRNRDLALSNVHKAILARGDTKGRPISGGVKEKL